MISRNSIMMCVLAAVMLAYLCFAMMITADSASRDHLRPGIDVSVSDTLMTNFITPADIIRECGLDPDTLGRCRIGDFGLDALEKRLSSSDKVESVNAWISTTGKVHVDVVPMTPVARIFEKGSRSYYINSQGKRISADPRYHLDVPVVLGDFDSVYLATRLLPLLDHIARRPDLSALVSTLVQQPGGNIIIVPSIVGHVINFGDTADVDDKFRRLRSFYLQVVPHRGWEMYDTIAVKWRGRVVATKRKGRLAPTALATVFEDSLVYNEFDDVETMTDPTTVADGLADEEKILPQLPAPSPATKPGPGR